MSAMPAVKLYLVRHAKVTSHNGDVPLADDAQKEIDQTARYIASKTPAGEPVHFLTTQTLRSTDTAKGLRDVLARIEPGLDLAPLRDEYAIRNPDLYLAGHRVEMVSNGAAMARQLPEGLMTGEEVETLGFFGEFFVAPDRIGYWLRHPSPPGEDVRAVSRRVVQFSASLGHLRNGDAVTVIAVSHSPVLRAVLVDAMGLDDPGEPDWVEPIEIIIEGEQATIAFRDERKVFHP